MGELITRSYRPGQQQLPPAAPVESIEPATGLPDSVDTCIHGFAKQGFEAVRDAFAANLYGGADIGASAAVFIDGEAVVDLWGGYFDATYTRPWERDTIVSGFSSTKTMTALCALVLADRRDRSLRAS